MMKLANILLVMVTLCTVMVGSFVFLPTNSAEADLVGRPTTGSGNFTDPLNCSVTNCVKDLLAKVIKFLLGLVGLLALLALIWGGISMIIGLGSEDKVAHAKKIIFWAVAGLIVVGLAYAIVRVVAQDLLGIQ